MDESQLLRPGLGAARAAVNEEPLLTDLAVFKKASVRR